MVGLARTWTITVSDDHLAPLPGSLISVNGVFRPTWLSRALYAVPFIGKHLARLIFRPRSRLMVVTERVSLREVKVKEHEPE